MCDISNHFSVCAMMILKIIFFLIKCTKRTSIITKIKIFGKIKVIINSQLIKNFEIIFSSPKNRKRQSFSGLVG
ncbi:hypothetical protein BpHYR1_022062 [Brachionus plicatilis]|uniref:Uncharacterized protein n=1 Tax=Brachionus plicatilis TaxID=10195 RepID=A0A3M7PIK2_BRAPC|nr:hypothetical protein BpHYR1_022062 [Brachionus plicatilis]